jgi:hypothetical protein
VAIIPTDLPNYIQQKNMENYNEEFNQTLRNWFSSSGFYQPMLNNTQVSELLALIPAPANGTHWLNSDLNKMQFIDATGVVQTITSS